MNKLTKIGAATLQGFIRLIPFLALGYICKRRAFWWSFVWPNSSCATSPALRRCVSDSGQLPLCGSESSSVCPTPAPISPSTTRGRGGGGTPSTERSRRRDMNVNRGSARPLYPMRSGRWMSPPGRRPVGGGGLVGHGSRAESIGLCADP